MYLARLFLIMLSASLFFSPVAQASSPISTKIAASVPNPSEKESALIERGKYVAQLGDCVACHTADKGSAQSGRDLCQFSHGCDSTSPGLTISDRSKPTLALSMRRVLDGSGIRGWFRQTKYPAGHRRTQIAQHANGEGRGLSELSCSRPSPGRWRRPSA